MIDTAWLANAAAILVMFIIIYIVLRLTGGALTQSVRQTGLSGLDRMLGFGIGVVRALVVMGAFTLVLNAATPPERMPAWISDAQLYPLASAAGDSLRAFAPKGLKVAHDVAPGLADAVMGPPAAKPEARRGDSYESGRRRDNDDQVEEPR
jgi:membrane protein required for colicin V production